MSADEAIGYNLRERVRQRLAAAGEDSALDASDADALPENVAAEFARLGRIPKGPLRDAAVLIALVDRPCGWTVLLIERAVNLPEHAGQVGLPGGRRASARETPEATALREAREEVGLSPSSVSVAGRMRSYCTITGFCVVPIVGFVPGNFQPQPDAGEVASVFEVPLALMLGVDAFAPVWRERGGTRFQTPEFCFEGHCIWGATATILGRFARIIKYE